MNSFIYKSEYLKRYLKIYYDKNKIRSLVILPRSEYSLNQKISHKNHYENTLKKYLDVYFNKGFFTDDFQYKLEGTKLQNKVWVVLSKIPRDITITYSKLAKLSGYPKAIRAVATAVGKNPIPILIPCHLVIRSSGEIGNYTGGISLKKKLITLEVKA
jgi:O-6-methylguanine DNA methyltransferase